MVSLYSGCLLLFLSFKFKVVGGGPTCQSLFFACAKKSNQKKAHNLTKIDPDITYLFWDSRIQYILAAPTKTFFTRLNWSSKSKLSSSQYHCVAADFSKHNEATTNKFSRLLFILEQVKTEPDGRILLLSSACRSKENKKIIIERSVGSKVKELNKGLKKSELLFR